MDHYHYLLSINSMLLSKLKLLCQKSHNLACAIASISIFFYKLASRAFLSSCRRYTSSIISFTRYPNVSTYAFPLIPRIFSTLHMQTNQTRVSQEHWICYRNGASFPDICLAQIFFVNYFWNINNVIWIMQEVNNEIKSKVNSKVGHEQLELVPPTTTLKIPQLFFLSPNPSKKYGYL